MRSKADIQTTPTSCPDRGPERDPLEGWGQGRRAATSPLPGWTPGLLGSWAAAGVKVAPELRSAFHGRPRPSQRWRAKGHCREVTVSKGAPLCSQQGSCVLGFHMGLRKRGSGAQG